MKKALLFILVAVLLCVPVAAQEEPSLVDAEALKGGLTEEAKELLEDADPLQASQGRRFWKMISGVLSDSGIYLRSSAKTSCRILGVLVLCSAAAGLENTYAVQAVSLAGTLALTSICVSDLRSMIGLAGETADQISVFSRLLLPALSAVMTASGGVTAGSALYAGTVMFLDLLVTLVHSVLIPLTYLYVLLAAADAAAGQGRLKEMKKLTGWVISVGMKGIVRVFTAFLAITGIVSGTADAAALKAAKSAISGAVPVVGGILSGAAGSVLASAEMLKSSVGVFGMLAVLATGVTPFVRIAIAYLMLKVTAAVSGTVGLENHCGLLDSLSSAMGYMLAMVGSCMLMVWIACCCFMKVVNV